MIFYEMAKTGHSTQQNKKIMLRRSILFVVAYIFQFTPIIAMSVQIYVGQEVPFDTVLFVVFNTNLGGFLNVIAYGLPNLSRAAGTKDSTVISVTSGRDSGGAAPKSTVKSPSSVHPVELPQNDEYEDA
eukprot:TRINITY_DN4318_c0_g1_i11.p1 TRINITY_DN4318_c0_g1~~TRINITY_DN4318_c0_g1_i11.p1  ORF type:complete len:129 (-),score=30.72 TRINITY_DN4318_c0_g1_i11:292-678(-)